MITSTDGQFEMDGMPDGDFHIWGFSYNGVLDAASIEAGQTVSGMISDNCYSLSMNFLTVVRAICAVGCDGGIAIRN